MQFTWGFSNHLPIRSLQIISKSLSLYPVTEMQLSNEYEELTLTLDQDTLYLTGQRTHQAGQNSSVPSQETLEY